ncbi:hypothetical protein CRYUN_Cryun30bG0011300 [Craigia yunnanensis]
MSALRSFVFLPILPSRVASKNRGNQRTSGNWRQTEIESAVLICYPQQSLIWGCATEQRLAQAALMSTCSSSSNSHIFSQKLADRLGLSRLSLAHGVAGTMLFSMAASSLTQDAHAKELPRSGKFLPNEVVLYQYEACSFCNKVKDIVNKLFHRTNSDSSIPDGDEEKKCMWMDNHLVHVLSANIYQTTSEALESFDYITTHGNFSFTERLVAKYAGAAAMYIVSRKLKYNITDERVALYEAAGTWVDVLKSRHYLGGSKPNLADLAIFGVLRPIPYLKSGKDMLEHTRIGEWYTRMENAVGGSARFKE